LVFPLGEIAPAARTELEAWQGLAREWSWYLEADPDTGVQVARCVSCHIAGWRVTDEAGNAYAYDAAQLLALKVAHLRQAHQDRGPKWL
jgi:hypothetical protein